MKSQRQVEREYKEMLEQNQKEVLPNRVNCYTCPSCRHITKTIDVAHGVTPMFHTCEQCKTMASSSFYKDIAPDQYPTQEWFRPTLKQCMKMRKNEGLLEHILMGGLDVRKRKVVKKRADKLQPGDKFKLDTIKPHPLTFTVIDVTDSSIDTTCVYVHCKEQDRVVCHKNELVIIV